MKKGWLIYTRFEAQRNDFFVNQLLQNAKKFDIELTLLIKETLRLTNEQNGLFLTCDDKRLPDADFAIVRTNDFLLSFQLEQMGLRVFNNSRTSLIANDKYLTYCFATNLNIPTPDTLLIEKSNENWQNLEQGLFPMIAKPLNQKGGKDVVLLSTYEDFLQQSKSFADKFLLQKPAKLGLDMRVYVLGKKILLGVKRTSDTDFRSNFCLGGHATVSKPNFQQLEIIDAILKNLDADYIGIDFLFDGNKVLLNELEDVVGARMIYTLTDINPAIEFLKIIAQKI